MFGFLERGQKALFFILKFSAKLSTISKRVESHAKGTTQKIIPFLKLTEVLK